MGNLSVERMQAFDEISWKYYDWLTVLQDAGITEIQDLQGQYLLKCPFHVDDYPSFRIKLDEHYYHCFSCGAFGSIADLMWKLSGQSYKRSKFYDNLLRVNQHMQAALGFSSLFIDSRTLDPALKIRRTFNPTNHVGSAIPISVLATNVRKMSDTWESLVYSLSLLQDGASPVEVQDKVKMVFSGMPGTVTDKSTSSKVGSPGVVKKMSLSELLEQGDIEV